MNVNSLIESTLQPLGYPVAFGKYEGNTSPYIVFNYADDRAVSYADDTPQLDVASVQVHLFAPKTFNHMTVKRNIRARLHAVGFSYPAVSTFYEDDTNLFHLVFECEIFTNSETEVI